MINLRNKDTKEVKSLFIAIWNNYGYGPDLSKDLLQTEEYAYNYDSDEYILDQSQFDVIKDELDNIKSNLNCDVIFK